MADPEYLHDRATAALRTGDTAAARQLFRQAGELGRLDSAVIYTNFLATGVGGERNWQNALAMLRALAKMNPHAARQLALIDAMQLTADGDPVSLPAAEPVCDAPRGGCFRARTSRTMVSDPGGQGVGGPGPRGRHRPPPVASWGSAAADASRRPRSQW